MILRKMTTLFTIIVFLQSSNTFAKKIEDISFETPLICENYRKSVIFANISLNINRFSKFIVLAYFTDGYPNTADSAIYTTKKVEEVKNGFNFEMLGLNGNNVYDYKPQKSGKKTICNIKLENDWRKKIKQASIDVKQYQTKDFEVVCEIETPLNYGVCKSENLKINNINLDVNSVKMPYNKNFNYRTWKE